MKKIIHNEYNLKKEEINHEIKRAKLLLINDNNEFLICHSYDTYHIIGGHVNKNESDIDCILREVKEEAGIILETTKFTPIMEIEYYCKNYPELGLNTAYINHYYYLKTDKKPQKRIMKLTNQEEQGKFKIKRIHKSKIMNVLKKEYEKSSRKKVIMDTMQVIEEYLKKTNQAN